MSDTLANFICLDELIQVIYQSIYKFVVLSTVSDSAWNIYVGLNGTQGRWWHGSWSEGDIHRFFGPKSSDKLLETAAEKMADAFVQGELCITDWSVDKGAKIKLTVGPAAKKPMEVDLLEMSPEDAAAHATSVFIEIALQAQSRKCCLHPSFAEYSGPRGRSPPVNRTSPAPAALPSEGRESGLAPGSLSEANMTTTSTTRSGLTLGTDTRAAQEEINSLKSQLESVKRKGTHPKDPVAVTTIRQKGASLANPNKKARKYQAIEFESDDE